MNPFMILTSPAIALNAHQRLAVLQAFQHIVPPDPDDDEGELEPAIVLKPAPKPRLADDSLAVVVSKTRTYRPKGKTRDMLRALQLNGPMTSAALGRVGRCPPGAVQSLLAIPLGHGLVVKLDGRPVRWSAA